jgi:hypothetical protein
MSSEEAWVSEKVKISEFITSLNWWSSNLHILHINKNDFIIDELNDNLDDFLPTNYIADVVHKYRNTEIPQITNSYSKQIIEVCT